MTVKADEVLKVIKDRIQQSYKRDISTLDCIGSIEKIITDRLSLEVHKDFEGRDTPQLLMLLDKFITFYTDEELEQIETWIKKTKKTIDLGAGKVYITDIEKATHMLFQELGFIDIAKAHDIYNRIEPMKQSIRKAAEAKQGKQANTSGNGQKQGKLASKAKKKGKGKAVAKKDDLDAALE